jgi:glycosyltransferase involved in cell wall biosynthesis
LFPHRWVLCVREASKMRIAFVCGFAWEPKGTVRARAFPLAAELVNRGHQVTIFLVPYDNPNDSRKEEVLEGVRIVNMQVARVSSLRQAPVLVKRLCNAVERYSADAVHVFKPKGYAGAACAWLLMKGSRSVVLDCDDWEGWGGWNEVKSYPWLVKEYIDRQEQWLVRRIPVVTAASRTLEQRAVKLRESEKGVFYIPNCGASRENILHQETVLALGIDEAKKSFGLSEELVIFYSGHVEAGKETMFFCRAAARAALRFGAIIVIVGDGPGISQMKESFSREGVAARFFPRLPYREFVRLVAASDITVFPYPDDPIHQAKCSARIIDYMTMGKAVVTTGVGQNADYIVDGESGILAPAGDENRFRHELEKLLQCPDLRVRLGREARQRIKAKFSWSGEPVENCLAAYQHLLKPDLPISISENNSSQ